jgi:outer membrane protein insertion porin family
MCSLKKIASLLYKVFMVLFLLQSFATGASAAMGGGMSPPPKPAGKDKDKKREERDPALLKLLKLKPLGGAAKAALERSKQPGVLEDVEARAGMLFQIRLVGAKKIEPDAVIAQIGSQVGQPLSTEQVAEDIKNIFSMGLFTNVEALEDEGPNGSKILNYEIKEKPGVRKIVFIGNESVGEDELLETIDLKPNFIVDAARAKENAARLRKFYRDKGFFLADVSFDLVNVADSMADQPQFNEFVDVIFTIEENTKVKVEQISVVGNEHISEDDIKAAMRTREEHFLSFISDMGTYREDVFDVDMMLIERLYQDRGYINVKIGKPRITLSHDKAALSIVIPISEGEQFRLGDLNIQGDFVVDADEALALKKRDPDKFVIDRDKLLSRIRLKSGDVFNKTQFSADAQSIEELYRDEGYAYVNIAMNPRLREGEHAIDFDIDISSGDPIWIERINIKGNDKTADEVIRREMRIYEGELYSSSLLRLSERRVRALGFFEQVAVAEKPGTAPDKMVLEFTVVEKSSRQVLVQGGYVTGGEGFVFQGQLADHNVFGRGQDLSLNIQWSRFRRIFELRFADPYIALMFDNPLFFSFSVYNSRRFLGSFTRLSTGADVTLGYPVGAPLAPISRKWLKDASVDDLPYIPDFENLRFFLTYVGDRSEISNEVIGVRLWSLKTNQPRYTTALRATLQFDQRNNRLNPSAGFFSDIRSELASSYLGALPLANLENGISENSGGGGVEDGLWFMRQQAKPNNFHRLSFNARAYYNFDKWFVWKDWVLRFNIDVGYLNTFGEELLMENYRLGALNSVRGYYFQSIGPVSRVGRVSPDQPLNEFVVGGNKQFVFNAELEFPLVRPLNLSWVLFYDMGNVWASDENMFFIGGHSPTHVWAKPMDPLGIYENLGLYASFGFGLRWLTPLGLFRFEWGIPATPRVVGTPGMRAGDSPILFDFSFGSSF